jgi:hypothetical protein
VSGVVAKDCSFSGKLCVVEGGKKKEWVWFCFGFVFVFGGMLFEL